MNSLFTSTGLDKEDLRSKFVGIIEESTANSSAVISSFAINSLQRDGSLLLCSLHYSFVHYRFVLSKFGVNLSTALSDGRAIHVDNLVLEGSLLAETVKSLEKLRESRDSVTVLVDDVSDLLISGKNLRTTLEFLQGLRSAAAHIGNVTLVVGCHWNPEDLDLSSLKSYIDSTADYLLHISPLVTGFSRDVSGVLIFSKFSPELAATWSTPNKLHFKLSDRMVKYFPPGSFRRFNHIV